MPQKIASNNTLITLKKGLRKRIKQIDHCAIQPVAIFSIFDHWLNDMEFSNAVISSVDVNSMDDYLHFRQIERQYLNLLVELNRNFTLHFVKHKMKPDQFAKETSFNDIFLKVVSNITGITGLKNCIIYLEKIDAFIELSYDLGIYVYPIGKPGFDALKSVFLNNGFSLLAEPRFD